MVVSQDAIRVVERYCQASGTLVGTVQVEEQVFGRDDNTKNTSVSTCGGHIVLQRKSSPEVNTLACGPRY